MSIIAGKHRGRRLEAPEGNNLRPTADRLRESIFGILSARSPNPIAGARVLDVFAGTGAMGLEALSRGAAHVTFLENHPEALDLLRRNAALFDAAGRITILNCDATRPGRARMACDLALLDPPYGAGLAEPSKGCQEAHRMSNGAATVRQARSANSCADSEQPTPIATVAQSTRGNITLGAVLCMAVLRAR
ncbi:MAG: RsmD family RNA methyltransferase [Planctomycetes bacterium]|nr:RsmD family RNA methyltransferase [Planctomycetota bacterium]